MDLEPIERIAYSTMVGRTEDPNREPGWLYYHCQRTGKIALWLAEQLQLNGKIDLDVIYVGALLHDIAKGTNSHNEAGANLVRKALVPHCSPIEIDGICEIIRDHNQRGVPDQPISVKIVQDADFLDHIGPIGLWLMFYWSGSNDESFQDHIRFFRGEENARIRREMRERMNFDISRQEFDRRIAYENEILGTFHDVYMGGIWKGGR